MPIDSPDNFEQTAHRSRREAAGRDAPRHRRALARRVDRRGAAGKHPSQSAPASAAGGNRARVSRSAAHGGGKEPAVQIVHRDGLLRHDHAERDPAEPVRKPVVVHAVHALPGGNCAGPPRVASQFSDDGPRSDGDGDRDGVAAGRGDGSRRGDDAAASRAGPAGLGRAQHILGVRAHLSPGARGAEGARRAARHHHRVRRSVLGAVRQRRVRRIRAVPGRLRRARRPSAVHRAGARAERARGRCHRSSCAHHCRASRRNGRGRRRRQRPAARRADGLWRPSCGVSRDARGIRQAGARPHHRRVGRLARKPRVSHGAADARAAHPPREGDVEHLHGAGAARQHRRDVRRVSRARRADGDRAAHARPGVDARDAPRRPWATVSRTTLLRHAAHSGSRRHRRNDRSCEGHCRACGAEFPVLRQRAHRHRARRNDDARRRAGHCRRSCRGGRETGSAHHGRRVAARAAGWTRAQIGIHDASGLLGASFGNEDDALSEEPRAEGRRTRPLDDPARLVHDEAERGIRDDPCHVAGVLGDPPIRAARAGAGVRASHQRARAGARGNHRFRSRVAAAQLGRAGRARRPDGDSRLPPFARRREARRRADPGVCAWNEPGERSDGGPQSGGRRRPTRTATSTSPI